MPAQGHVSALAAAVQRSAAWWAADHRPTVYYGAVARVVDGDTVNVDVQLAADLGAALVLHASVRLRGINARERSEPGGPEAAAYLAGLLPAGAPVALTVVSPDKYSGRCDAVITTAAGVDVAAAVVAAGYAAVWDGHGQRPVPPWPIPEPAQ
jgi:endonuclease YncB( thermonuclease family)